MYQSFVKVIENVNIVISTYESEECTQINPEEGTVAFGAGLHGWAFTISDFARVLSEKLNVDKAMLQKKLWGDNFYDPKAKKWVKTDVGIDGTPLKRGFVQFIMDPIIRLSQAIMNNEKEAVFKMLDARGILLKEHQKEKIGKDLLKCVF